MTKYNQNFKQQVVDFYFEHHENLPHTLRHFGLKRETVRRWIAQFKHSGNFYHLKPKIDKNEGLRLKIVAIK